MKLTSIFLDHLPAECRPAVPLTDGERAEVAALLARLLDEAQGAWPDVLIPPEDFIAYLAERLVPGEPLRVALTKIVSADLYLACGCTRGEAAALAAFERHYMARLAAHLAKGDALPAFTDEVKQAVRVRLLVAENGPLPRIGSYRGRGPLAVWLRLTAVRLAVNLRNSSARQDRQSHDLDRLQSPNVDPEMAFFKAHYGDELRRAVEGALAALPAKDGNILRLHFFEGLSAATIGVMYDVSERTVQRWITGIRKRILAETRRLLNQRFPLTHAQFDSVIGLVNSQLQISIRRLLEKPGADTLSRSPGAG